MSIALKIVIPIAIAIAAIWGYLTYAHPSGDNYQPQPGAIQQQSQTPDATTAAHPQENAGLQIGGRGTSDASLEADLKAVDASIQSVSQSSTNIDQSMDDQAGDTSY